MCSSVVYTIKKMKKPFGCYNINIQAGSFYLESTGSALNQSWAKLSETGQARNHKCGWCGGTEYDNSKGIRVPLTPDSLRTAAFAQYLVSLLSYISCLSFSLSRTQRGLHPFGMVGFSTKFSKKERKALPHPTGLWLFLEVAGASRLWLSEPQVSVSIPLWESSSLPPSAVA